MRCICYNSRKICCAATSLLLCISLSLPSVCRTDVRLPAVRGVGKITIAKRHNRAASVCAPINQGALDDANAIQPVRIKPAPGYDGTASVGETVEYQVDLPPGVASNNYFAVTTDLSTAQKKFLQIDGQQHTDIPYNKPIGDATHSVTITFKTFPGIQASFHIYVYDTKDLGKKRATTLTVTDGISRLGRATVSLGDGTVTGQSSEAIPLPVSVATSTDNVQAGAEEFDCTVGVNALNARSTASTSSPRELDDLTLQTKLKNYVIVDCDNRDALRPLKTRNVKLGTGTNGWPIRLYYTRRRTATFPVRSVGTTTGMIDIKPLKIDIKAFRNSANINSKTSVSDYDADSPVTIKNLTP